MLGKRYWICPQLPLNYSESWKCIGCTQIREESKEKEEGWPKNLKLCQTQLNRCEIAMVLILRRLDDSACNKFYLIRTTVRKLRKTNSNKLIFWICEWFIRGCVKEIIISKHNHGSNNTRQFSKHIFIQIMDFYVIFSRWSWKFLGKFCSQIQNNLKAVFI